MKLFDGINRKIKTCQFKKKVIALFETLRHKFDF